MGKRLSRVSHDKRPFRAAFAVAATLALLVSLGYPLVARQAQSARAAEPLSCPTPVYEGETWISRQWIIRGELQLECIHIAGFPALDWSTARKAGLVQ